MTLTDTHCHLDFDCFDGDREQVLQRAADAGVRRIIVPGTQQSRWPRISRLCNGKHPPRLWPCFGIHPYWLTSHSLDDLDALQRHAQTHDCLAIGECGLDFRDGQAARDLQHAFFDAQLALAQRLDKPVIIHAVRATGAVIRHIRQFPGLRGVIHAYSGSYEQARQLIDLGFMLGIGGVITRPDATKRHRLLRQLPVDAIVLETDAPDQPPYRHRQQRNEPGWLVETLQSVSELKQQDSDALGNQFEANVQRLFFSGGENGPGIDSPATLP